MACLCFVLPLADSHCESLVGGVTRLVIMPKRRNRERPSDGEDLPSSGEGAASPGPPVGASPPIGGVSLDAMRDLLAPIASSLATMSGTLQMVVNEVRGLSTRVGSLESRMDVVEGRASGPSGSSGDQRQAGLGAAGATASREVPLASRGGGCRASGSSSW